jgi:hypothetical protein
LQKYPSPAVVLEFDVVDMSVLYFFCSSELILLHVVFHFGKDVKMCANSVIVCPSEIHIFVFFLIPCTCALVLFL